MKNNICFTPENLAELLYRSYSLGVIDGKYEDIHKNAFKAVLSAGEMIEECSGETGIVQKLEELKNTRAFSSLTEN